MQDQAAILRGLMERRHESATSDPLAPQSRAQTVAVTSGKGGVGKSNIALNLAVALQQKGHRACLLDANLGLGNLDLLCGLNGYWNLSHVMSGARTVADVLLEGPAGIHVIPGASGLNDVADCSPAAQRDVLSQLDEMERTHDFLIIDTGSGIHRAVRQFAAAADLVLVVTTPEPTSIADAYAAIKALTAGTELQPHVLVNQSDSTEIAREIISRMQQTARTFLHAQVHSAGSIPRDPCVPQAVFRRIPFMLDNPESPASRAMELLARRIINLAAGRPSRGAYFNHFGRMSERSAA